MPAGEASEGRGGRWSAPVHLVCAAPDYLSRPVRGKQGVTSKVARRVWWGYSRRRGRLWSREPIPREDGPRDFWESVAAMCHDGRRVYVIAPSAADLCTSSGFWHLVSVGLYRVIDRTPLHNDDVISDGPYQVKWAAMPVMTGRVDIIKARVHKGSVVIVSRTNYAEPSWAELARSVGYVLPAVDQDEERFGRTEPMPIDQVGLLQRWFRGFVLSWIDKQLGTFGTTAGQLSLSVWRSLDGRRAARRHRRPDALALECGAAWGGRASAWFFGDAGTPDPESHPGSYPPPADQYPRLAGPVYRYDVRSMFPWLLGEHEYPVQLCGVTYNLEPYELEQLMEYWSVVACVRLDTTLAEFPCRICDSVRYPVGRFDTVLAGPELTLALRQSAISRVYAVARYRTGRPFRMWSQCVLDGRYTARRNRDSASELLWKCIGNSFHGKFAQRSTRWVMDPGVIPLREWGEYPTFSRTKGTYQRCRAIAGVQYHAEPATPGHRLPLAVYAYVTSYSRVRMCELRSALPPRQTLSQDTDGLHLRLSPSELPEPVRQSLGTEPGRLRVLDAADYARYFSPKHYCIDGRWTLAGYCDGWTFDGPAAVRERLTVNPARGGSRQLPTRLFEVVRTVDIPAVNPETPIGPDGWAHPYEIDPRFEPPPLPPPVRDLFTDC